MPWLTSLCCPTPNSVPMLACVWRQNTCIRPDNTTRLNFKTSTASPCATAVGHREKPFTAISADSMALPAPSHPAARCSPVHWQICTRDVFVYPGNGRFLGYAVIVVAVNKNGKKAFLLAEGNTPARDIHLIRNLENPFRSPWFNSDGSEKRFLLSITPFKVTDLRHYWAQRQKVSASMIELLYKQIKQEVCIAPLSTNQRVPLSLWESGTRLSLLRSTMHFEYRNTFSIRTITKSHNPHACTCNGRFPFA